MSNQIGKEKTLIPKMKNAKGETVTSRKGIANVFGEFHGKLYDEEEDDNEEYDHCRAEKNTRSRGQKSDDNKSEIPQFSKTEVQAIDSLKKGKASDNNGIRAEDIKACSDKTKEMMRKIFNEVLKQEDCTSTTWRRIRMKVIHKKGDVEGAGNYRPICTLPALYKIFSTLLYNRHYPRLDRVRPDDQGGFRRSCQTLDHLAAFKFAEQKCPEWCVKMWILTVDFMRHLTALVCNISGAAAEHVM